MSTILIVDDAPIVREPIAASLRMAGFQTVCASNGEEAMLVIQMRRPDLILMDLAMPKMNGAEALKQIRTNAATADIPVIVLTAGTDPMTIGTLGFLRPTDCLFKSNFSLPELIARVKKHLAA